MEGTRVQFFCKLAKDGKHNEAHDLGEHDGTSKAFLSCCPDLLEVDGGIRRPGHGHFNNPGEGGLNEFAERLRIKELVKELGLRCQNDGVNLVRTCCGGVTLCAASSDRRAVVDRLTSAAQTFH